MAENYHNLSFNNQKKAVLSIIDDFSSGSQHKIALAIEVSSAIEKEEDKKFRLNQTLFTVLWEKEEIVNIGFQKWVNTVLVDRHHAMIYHSINVDECSDNCVVCKVIGGYST
jgi:hypothetical protein